MYEVITGYAPFNGYSKDKLYAKVMCGNDRPDLERDDYGRSVRAKENVKALLQRCWDRDPTRRPSSAECMEVFGATEEITASEEQGQGFLRKTVKKLFGSKDSI